MRWVLLRKVTEAVGYTDDAIRAKIKTGRWVYGTHWRKAPDGHLVFNLEAINQWMQSRDRA